MIAHARGRPTLAHHGALVGSGVRREPPWSAWATSREAQPTFAVEPLSKLVIQAIFINPIKDSHSKIVPYWEVALCGWTFLWRFATGVCGAMVSTVVFFEDKQTNKQTVKKEIALPPA